MLCSLKLADMALSKQLEMHRTSFDAATMGQARGSAGWQAPELVSVIDDGIDEQTRLSLLSQRLTRAIDLFSAGCILQYTLCPGQHPFGEAVEREINVKRFNRAVSSQLCYWRPEAAELVMMMTSSDPNSRCSIDDAVKHPLFWDDEKRLQFLLDCSDRVECEPESSSLRLALERSDLAPLIVSLDWSQLLDQSLIDNLGRYRKYAFDSIRDALRVIRNKKNHYADLPTDVKEMLGPLPHGFLAYFTTRMPLLLMYCYAFICNYAVIQTPNGLLDGPIADIPLTPISKISGVKLDPLFMRYLGDLSARRIALLQRTFRFQRT